LPFKALFDIVAPEIAAAKLPMPFRLGSARNHRRFGPPFNHLDGANFPGLLSRGLIEAGSFVTSHLARRIELPRLTKPGPH
jgi:hypothetical protein